MIPVFEPSIGNEEITLVVEALRRGEISGSFGKFIPEFEEKFAAFIGVRHAVAVTSGTTALHLAASVAGIGVNDEVLVSASTNIATGLAAYHHGAIPIAVDSESETWNLDLNIIESLITPRTKAVIPVHLFGHPVDMDSLMSIAQKHGLIVIEDCAESHGATIRGRMTGSFGDMSCFSFYANKIITTGEGGMICTNNDAYAEKLRLLRNLAFTKPRFRHELAGYNFRMTGYQAAMGIAQLHKIEEIVAAKRQVAHWYDNLLADLSGLQLPIERSWAKNVYWMYGVVIHQEFGISRDKVMQQLQELGIETRSFFCPMNIQPCFKDLTGWREISCPIAEKLWENGFYLPSSPLLTYETILHISESLKIIYNNANC